MSARVEIEFALARHFRRNASPQAAARELLARYDAEAGPEDYPGELAMLRGLVATLHAVAEHGDLPDVRKVLAEHKSDEAEARAEQQGGGE